MSEVLQWHLAGDWFDVCKCAIPCPCTFAQAPTHGDCEGILAWHVREGHYGDARLDGLNVVALGAFEGNVWEGATKVTMGMYMDERADEAQREALTVIFSGQGGGWPGEFASMVGEVRGIEYVPITFEIADDLAYWAAEVPGKATARAEALTGPTAPAGQRVRLHNSPGRRSIPARLRPGAGRRPTAPTASASSGNGTGARASTSRSTGRAPSRCEAPARPFLKLAQAPQGASTSF